jgi:hypothetical protein
MRTTVTWSLQKLKKKGGKGEVLSVSKAGSLLVPVAKVRGGPSPIIMTRLAGQRSPNWGVGLLQAVRLDH